MSHQPLLLRTELKKSPYDHYINIKWRDNMEVIEAIKGRRSIRRFQDKKIPDPIIKELLNLALYAPSSMNGQPWHFIVIREDKTKRRLVEIKNKYCPLEKKDYQADCCMC
jgi:nitroreductase